MGSATERIERHLAEMARDVGAAPWVRAYLPRDLEGLEEYGYDPDLVTDDLVSLQVERHGKTFELRLGTQDEVFYFGGGDGQYPGGARSYYIANETMEEAADDAYSAARCGGHEPSGAMEASSLVYELTPEQIEVYKTLLADGTSIKRAHQLAKVVEGTQK